MPLPDPAWEARPYPAVTDSLSYRIGMASTARIDEQVVECEM